MYLVEIKRFKPALEFVATEDCYKIKKVSDGSYTDFKIFDFTLIITNLSEDADKTYYSHIAEKLHFLATDYLCKHERKSNTSSEFCETALFSRSGPIR